MSNEPALPTRKDVLSALVNDGPVPTLSVAAIEVAVPTALVNTARYMLPLSPGAVVNVYVVLVAPAMFTKLAPPSVERCHWTVGVGTPEAAARKLTGLPGETTWSLGFVVT